MKLYIERAVGNKVVEEDISVLNTVVRIKSCIERAVWNKVVLSERVEQNDVLHRELWRIKLYRSLYKIKSYIKRYGE